MAIINITISGINKTTTFLKHFRKDLRKPTEPLRNSSKMYLNAMSANFQNEGKTFSSGWAPLSPATIAIKEKLKKEGKAIAVKQILVRTGKLRKSFNYVLKGKSHSIIFNKMDYAMTHQHGGTVEYPKNSGKMRDVPPRILAAVDNKRVKNIKKIFDIWIGQLIKKHSKK